MTILLMIESLFWYALGLVIMFIGLPFVLIGNAAYRLQCATTKRLETIQQLLIEINKQQEGNQ